MDLYALPPEEFTAARDAAARADRSLKALRRPTVAAWVVNTLVRREPALVEDLAELGRALAEAQRAGRAADLRELAGRRHALVEQVTTTAVGLVERELSDAVRTEVAATLDAALADPASADAVRSGQLVRALSFAGFGGVDLQDAVAPLPRGDAAPPAAPSAAPSAARAEQTAASTRIQKLEAAALDAQGDLDAAVRQAERVARELDASVDDLQVQVEAERAAAASVEELRVRLDAAEAAHAQARSRQATAVEAAEEARLQVERAAKAVGQAQDAADAARKALDAARRA